MRHIGTLIAAIVIAPLAWVLLALGQARSAAVFANAHRAGEFHAGEFVPPLLVLAAAGLLLGMLGTLRVSPLGALVLGIVYSSSYTLLLVAPKDVLDMFAHNVSVAGRHADLVVPIRTGTTMMLGALLMVAAISVGRWRRRADALELTMPDMADTRDRPLGAEGLFAPQRVAEPGPAVRVATDSRPSDSWWSTTTPKNADYGW